MKKTFFKLNFLTLFVSISLLACSQNKSSNFTTLSDYKNSLSASEKISWHMSVPIGTTLILKDRVALSLIHI